VTQEFDPSSTAGKRWLGQMANQMAKTGTACQHISNNAPRDICESRCGEAQDRYRGGEEVAGRRQDRRREIDAGE